LGLQVEVVDDHGVGVRPLEPFPGKVLVGAKDIIGEGVRAGGRKGGQQKG
jgi:hypothetical protein